MGTAGRLSRPSALPVLTYSNVRSAPVLEGRARHLGIADLDRADFVLSRK